MPSRCHVDAKSMQSRCNADAKSMQRRCNVDAKSMHCRCIVEAKPMQGRCNVDAKSMQSRCKADAKPMQSRCKADAKSIQSQCKVNAKSMQCQCQVDAMSMQSRYKCLRLKDIPLYCCYPPGNSYSTLNHEVLLVGFGTKIKTSGNIDYWKIKYCQNIGRLSGSSMPAVLKKEYVLHTGSRSREDRMETCRDHKIIDFPLLIVSNGHPRNWTGFLIQRTLRRSGLLQYANPFVCTDVERIGVPSNRCCIRLLSTPLPLSFKATSATLIKDLYGADSERLHTVAGSARAGCSVDAPYCGGTRALFSRGSPYAAVVDARNRTVFVHERRSSSLDRSALPRTAMSVSAEQGWDPSLAKRKPPNRQTKRRRTFFTSCGRSIAVFGHNPCPSRDWGQVSGQAADQPESTRSLANFANFAGSAPAPIPAAGPAAAQGTPLGECQPPGYRKGYRRGTCGHSPSARSFWMSTAAERSAAPSAARVE
eukprot:gene14063-biopygen4467